MKKASSQAAGRTFGSALAVVVLALLAIAGTGGVARAEGTEWIGRVVPTSYGGDSVDLGGGVRERSYRRGGSARRGSYRQGASYRQAGGGTSRRGSRRGSASYGGSPFGASLSGGGVRWAAPSGCLNSTLRGVVSSMARFGGVTVSSTCRSHAHNRRVGGAPRSHHLTGNAVDFRVHGNVGAAYAALRSMGLGGVKHYGGGLFHVDTGPRRSF